MIVWLLVATLLSVLGVCFWWRRVCHVRSVPWPHWLAFMLENPYMKMVSPSKVLAERLDLQKGMRVIDVGCGSGRISLLIAKIIGENGCVYVLDVQAEMLAKLRRRMLRHGVSNFQTLHADILGDGPLAPAICQRALLVTVLGEVPNPEYVLRRLYQSLEVHGLLSITEVMPDPCFLTRKTVINLCQSAGFELVEEFQELLSYTLNFCKVQE